MALSIEDYSKRTIRSFRWVSVIIVTLFTVSTMIGFHFVNAETLDEEILSFTPRHVLNLVTETGQDTPEEIDYSQDPRVAAIRVYFENYNMPGAQHAEAFVRSADKYGLEEWAAIAAICRIESTCGKHVFQPNNYFGFGQKHFDSVPDAIDYVTMTFTGNNPRVAYAYADKTFHERLYSYNSVDQRYRHKVETYMQGIHDELTLLQQAQQKLAME